MFLITILLVLGIVMLYAGAELLVRGSSRLALRCGIPSLVIGLTIVAFSTSAPELVVSVRAGLDGLGDIAVGNIIGSNLFNICVILGLSAMVRPLTVNKQVLKFDTPVMIGVSLLLLVFLRDFYISRLEALILFSGICAYTYHTVSGGVKTAKELKNSGSDRPSLKGHVFIDFLFVIIGLAALVFGARFFVRGAVDLARVFNLSEALIGLTIVAAGTSLPELATSVVAAIKKEQDIAIGNIVGSNIFNILSILGIAGIITPLNAQGISIIDLYFMIGTAILLLPFMLSGFVFNRFEGAIMLAVYGGYLWYLWP